MKLVEIRTKNGVRKAATEFVVQKIFGDKNGLWIEAMKSEKEGQLILLSNELVQKTIDALMGQVKASQNTQKPADSLTENGPDTIDDNTPTNYTMLSEELEKAE